MKTDIELRTDILSELQWDASIRNEDIAVAVKEGVITLAGTVDSYAQQYAAERARSGNFVSRRFLMAVMGRTATR